MDLGSLELQIFVSLTVVLGAAFVALVCDYLKGNNEQLREHNIELRVRKEEQERRLLLDPAGFLGQWLPGSNAESRSPAPATTARTANGRTVAAHEVMQSFANPASLQQADARAASFQARGGESPAAADVPPLTERRNGKARSNGRGKRKNRSDGEKYADWVRPEVIARVARKAEAAASYASDIRDELEAARTSDLPEPLNGAENWDIRALVPHRERHSVVAKENTPVPVEAVVVEKASAPPVETHTSPEPEVVSVEPRLNATEAEHLQREIERVAQMERLPLMPAPGTILRPLTVPSLRLEEEIQRVAEKPAVVAPSASLWHSQLLEDVIAASSVRETVEPEVVLTGQPAEEEEPVLVEEKAPAIVLAETVPEAILFVDGAEPPSFRSALEYYGAAPPPPGVELPLTFEVPAEIENGGSLPEPNAELASFIFAVDAEPEMSAEAPLPQPIVQTIEESSPVFAELPAFTMDVDVEPQTIAESPAEQPDIEPEDETTAIAELPSFAFLGEAELAPVAEVLAAPPVVAAAEELMPAGTEVPAFILAEDTEQDAIPASLQVAAEDSEPTVAAIESVPLESAFEPYVVAPRPSHLAGMGISATVDYLPASLTIEKPKSALEVLSTQILPAEVTLIESSANATDSLPDLLPLYSDMSWEPLPALDEIPIAVESSFTADPVEQGFVSSQPPPFWQLPAAVSEIPAVPALSAPIDISAPRPEPVSTAPAQVANVPDLLLPTGMHDVSTWARLLTLPNPMTGILFVITLQSGETVNGIDRASAHTTGENAPAIDKLMASFVREGDFGTRISDTEWVFIYSHDVAGFNQRRVGMISEKLWDFQLRHLGMANVSFKWGAVDVKSEPLGEALHAARERMNQTRRSRKLPGASQQVADRLVVNG